MIYMFENCELDTHLYELRRGGRPVKVGPQVFNMFVYLIEHRDRVVLKQELFEHLWPNQFISNAALERCIKTARQIVGDSGSIQRVIKTIRGRGYRFVAPVSEQPHPSSDDTRSAIPHVEQRSIPPRQEQDCPRCGQTAHARATFCSACGQRLARTPSETVPTGSESLEGEQKQVTVLHGTLDGFSALSDSLESGNAYTLKHGFFKLVLNEVHRCEGTLHQLSDEGFIALFGAPVTQEDHARRAVQVAIGLRRYLRDELPAFGLPLRENLSIRVGLHTGTVMVWKTADDRQTFYPEVGTAMRSSARLHQLAEAGEILISDATYRLVRGSVRVEAVESRLLPEPPDSFPVWRVTGLRRQRSPAVGVGEPISGLFVNRTQELRSLQDLLMRVESGQGQAVGLVGEAGVGKSRLLNEFRLRLSGRRITYLRGRCLAYGGATPYLPVLDILRHNCGITERDMPEGIAEKVRLSLQELGMSPEDDALYLLKLMGIKEATERLATLSPGAIKSRTFELLRQMCLKGSQQRPLIVVVEDLHWIDKTSEDYMVSLVECLAAAPILLLTTYRAGYRPPWLEKSYATQIAMQRLTPEDSLSLIRTVLPPNRLPDPLAQAVLHRAEGNPFFLEELTRAVAEHTDFQEGMAIPDTIKETLMARIDRLPRASKQLLRTASILGRTFSLSLLETIWEQDSGLETSLRELQGLEFLHEQIGAEEPTYVFKHALTHEVAYESLPLPHRQALHAAAGQALEMLYAERLEEVYDRLAYHYARTKETVKAVMYLTRFAEEAMRSYAPAEAMTALHEAYYHAERLPLEERHGRIIDLILRQAFSLSVLGCFQEILDLLQAHQKRMEQLRDPMLAGTYYFRLGLTHTYLGHHEQASRYAQHAITAAARCGDRSTMGQAYYVLALKNYLSGQFQQGNEHGCKSVALLAEGKEPHWLSLAHWITGNNAAHMGDFKAALESEAQAHAVGETIGDPRLQSFADGVSGWISAMQGEWEAGIAVCQRSVERAPDPVTTTAARGYLGCAYLEQGDASRAIPLLEQAVQGYRQISLQQHQGQYTALLAEARRLQGQLETARDLASEGLTIAEHARSHYAVGLAQRTLGRIAQDRGDFPEAASHLSQALRTFTGVQARFEAARTSLDLATLAHHQSDRKTAASHLEAAYALFRDLQIVPYIKRSAHLAREYGIPLPQSPKPHGPASPL